MAREIRDFIDNKPADAHIIGQELLEHEAVNILPYLLNKYHEIVSELELDFHYDDCPLIIEEDLGLDDIPAGLKTSIGFNVEEEPVHWELHNIALSAKYLNELTDCESFEYVKAVAIAALAHELYHTYSYINLVEDDIDWITGRISNDGEVKARLFSIIVLMELMDIGEINQQVGERLHKELLFEIDDNLN